MPATHPPPPLTALLIGKNSIVRLVISICWLLQCEGAPLTPRYNRGNCERRREYPANDVNRGYDVAVFASYRNKLRMTSAWVQYEGLMLF